MSIKQLVPLVLPADPTLPLEAATKQYVDNNAGGGGGDLVVDDVPPADTSVLWADTTTQGSAAYTVLSGTRVPINTDGIDGDFWINTATWFIYGPKAAGVWPAGTSIVGPQGPKGDTGSQGVKGDTGDTGSQGPAGTGIAVGTTPPGSPAVNALWVDTS